MRLSLQPTPSGGGRSCQGSTSGPARIPPVHPRRSRSGPSFDGARARMKLIMSPSLGPHCLDFNERTQCGAGFSAARSSPTLCRRPRNASRRRPCNRSCALVIAALIIVGVEADRQRRSSTLGDSRTFGLALSPCKGTLSGKGKSALRSLSARCKPNASERCLGWAGRLHAVQAPRPQRHKSHRSVRATGHYPRWCAAALRPAGKWRFAGPYASPEPRAYHASCIETRPNRLYAAPLSAHG